MSPATAGEDGKGGGGGGCSNYGPGGKGGDGIVIVRFSAVIDGPIVKPVAGSVSYTGSEQIRFQPNPLAYVVDESVSTLKATDVGTYRIKVTMNPGFTWSDGTSDPVDITWSITKASNAISTFTLASWKDGSPNAPVLVANFGAENAVYTYEGTLDEGGVAYGPTSEQPSAPGSYTVAVEIPGTDNYAGATAGPVTFKILPGEMSPVAELGRYVEITAANYTGTTALNDFQMLVRVSEAAISGFKYDQAAPDGRDIRFTDADGNLLSFELDQWVPGGESLFWVKVPEFTAETKIVMCWGQVSGARIPEVDSRDTWSNYLGVWHMSETIAAADAATTKSRDSVGLNPGVPTKGGSGTLSEMVSCAGQVGNGRMNKSGIAAQNGNRLVTGAYTLNGQFTYSGWFKYNSSGNYPRIGGNKTGSNNGGKGWSIEANNGSASEFAARSDGDTGVTSYMRGDSLANGWVYMAFVFDVSQTNVTYYSNGAAVGSATLKSTISDDGTSLTIGNQGPTSGEWSLGGAYDEVRIFPGLQTAEWILADYNQMKGAGFATYDIAGKTKDVRLVNRWAAEPAIEPAQWDAGTSPEVFEKGRDSAGVTPTAIYRNVDTDEIVTNVFPTAAGKYEATFEILASSDYEGLVKTIAFEILSNRWVQEPTITPLWKEGDTPEIFRGEDVRGLIDDARGETAYIVYRNCSGNTYVTNVLPAVAGSYQAIFVVEPVTVGGIDYGPLECVRNFIISTESPYTDADGAQGANGRVLLMNRDLLAGSVVEYQGYYDNASRYVTKSTFWEYCNETPVDAFNLKPGTEFILWTMNYGSKLWHLFDCRHGNTFPAEDDDIELFNFPTQVFLPWSSTSKRITAHNSLSIYRQYVGQCVMRNTKGASVYSSCFTNGIGTIYFDAANGWVATGANAANFQIAVEIATNCVDLAGRPVDLPPTDENVRQVIAAHWEFDYTDPENITSNWVGAVTNEYGAANWWPAKLEILKRDYASTFDGARDFQKLVYDDITWTNEFQTCGATATNVCLAIANGGTIDNFYRIYIPLNYHGAIRFRIVRQSIDPGFSRYVDDGGLILLDNIVASYPQMRADMSAYGIFDEAKSGKGVLGQEATWSVPFPAAESEDVLARAKVEYYANAGVPGIDPTTFIVTTRLNYRWRYLNQQFYHDGKFYSTDDKVFSSVFLDPTDGFKAHDPLDLPGVPGDVEYFFETQLNAPFYDYADYSGTGLKLGGFYSEALPVVTNRRDSVGAPALPTGGTDWFVRLREGVSDVEQANLIVRRGSKDAVDTERIIPMELVDNHVWRGYLQTRTNDLSGAYYRIEFVNRQTPGDEDWKTNSTVYFTATTNSAGIISGVLSEALSDDDWSWTEVDAATGYLMFQTDDSTRAITAVHADYQNFNAWSDAKGKIFVGTSVEDETKIGTSQNKRDFVEDFDTWSAMSATNSHWMVPSFTDLDNLLGRTPFVSFASDTDNNWEIGQGMWVGKYYADQTANAKNKGVALQMEGQGKGYIQFTDKDDCPRGIESISFNARLGQSVKFPDFSYFDAEDKLGMKNYTFVTRSAFDLNENKNFTGNASLSLAAHYRPGKGCYEARWEQLTATWDGKGEATGIKPEGQRLCLYRWSVTGDGSLRSTLLTAVTNNSFKIPSTKGLANTDLFLPFFITVSNENNSAVWIMAGVKNVDAGNNVRGMSLTPLKNGAALSADKNWMAVCYRDNSQAALMNGTYGVVSANCEGVFGAPVVYSQAIPYSGFEQNIPLVDYNTNNKSARCNDSKNLQITFPSDTLATECYTDIASDHWVITRGRMQVDLEHDYDFQKNLRAAPATQKLKIFTAPAGKSDWTKLAETTISGFGTAGSPGDHSFNLWTTKDCSVRIAVDDEKTIDDARVDIVLDSIKLTQWRGNDYKDADEMSTLIPTWTDPVDYKGHTNFTFTSCWIRSEETDGQKKGEILMSAKRTEPGTPCAIRSPLMDGTYGRGKGLGMFSFSYRYAQPNVKLLLQIATNISYTTVGNIDNLDEATWHTVTNFTFKGGQVNSPVEQVCSCYIGLHDVQGIMRLVMDPQVVEDVVPVKNTSQFGEILITKVFCRDEPALDAGSWWGWNVRTLGMDSTGADDERRMFLPDYTTDPAELGLSIAVNNSITDGIDREDAETYRQNKPFVQTPTFTEDVVGEVAFRARKYDAVSTQPAAIMLYGSRTGDDMGTWEVLNEGRPFVISNNTYATFKYKTDPGQAYRAFRLCVNGVAGVPGAGAVKPDGYDDPVRVLIDEVVVSEAIRARVAFRNVGAFRSQLRDRNYVPNVPSKEEQPLCNEGWGVQCEVYAAQLADDINFDIEPMVYLHWFEGTSPWGYENWCSNSLAHTVRLPPAMDTNLIFRSTYLGNYADSVIPMSTVPGTTIQYTLEVRYWQKGSSVAMTNFLSEADWIRPPWYRPLDYNRDYGRGRSFAAYNILDTVAPGWAWINEANVFGSYDSSWNNSEATSQFVEIAVPMEADISYWYVNLLSASVWDGTVVTNRIGTFGSGQLPGMKKDGANYAADNMVFRVIGSQMSSTVWGGQLDPKNGELDAVWNFENESDTFLPSGEIFGTDPFGIQLVRASGIIEHEVLCVGTNYYGSMPGLEQYYNPTNTAQFLDEHLPESHFLYVGQDCSGDGKSLGVFTSRGETLGTWNNTMTMTPGRINQNQEIDPDHPTPNGETILVYASVDNAFGHIVQTVGDVIETNTTAMVYLTRGSARGTNIVYTVDPWYELGTVTATEKGKVSPVTFGPVADRKRTYVATVGVGASNNVTVVARAKLADDLVHKYGLDEHNRYTPAVVDWLEKQYTLDGTPWEAQDGDNIYLADFVALSGAVVTNMTLTQMYWLDMDPTVSNQAFVAGMAVPPLPAERLVEGYMGTSVLTNLKMGVFMMITNRCEDPGDTLHYGKAWTPYALRGLAPGENSLDFDNSSWGWTSVTFKVTGILANGLTGEQIAEDWVPLRWFVFHRDSFKPLGSATDPGISRIEVKDPYSTESPGYAAGWNRWVKINGYAPVFFSWALDERITPIAAEILCPTNYYNTTP